MRRFVSVVALFFVLIASVSIEAANWPQWRGPGQNGVAPGEDFPVEWGEDANIVWKVPIPGWGTSTPTIWEDRIFLTCVDEDKNALICLNRKGETQWLTPLGQSAGSRNNKASASNPSPTTDGEHVYCYFRSGELACLDYAGGIVWQTNLQEKYGPDRLWWDLGTSPVLTKELVVVAVMHQGPSYLVALNKKSGDVEWKQDRDVNAPREARDSYTTPLVHMEGNNEQLIVLGADHVTAHDAKTGEEVWRVGGLNPNQRGNYRSIASPVIAGDYLIAPYERGNTLTAIRLGGKGDVTDSHVVWSIGIPSSDVPTPVAYKGRIYLCSDRGEVTCLDAKSGETVWTERLPRRSYVYSASPIIADGHLYATREDGTTSVLKLGDTPELVASNSLHERAYSTPVFVDGLVFLRTSEFLFCIDDDRK